MTSPLSSSTAKIGILQTSTVPYPPPSASVTFRTLLQEASHTVHGLLGDYKAYECPQIFSEDWLNRWYDARGSPDDYRL